MSGNSIPARLYKYQSPTQMAIDNIRNRRLWFSKPKHFNDPFDCEINYRITDVNNDSLQTAKDELERERLAAFVFQERYMKEGNTDIKKMMELTRKLPKHVENIDAREATIKLMAIRASLKADGDSLGISCFSEDKYNILMWSHYADKHQGFCIGYKEEKIRKSGLFGRGGLVKYSSVYPQIKPDPTKRNLMDEIFLKTNTKAKQWSYEKEYRLVTTSFPRALQRKIVLPVEFISEVILGINISDKSKAEILKYTISKKIPTFQAQKAAFKFKMLRKRIA